MKRIRNPLKMLGELRGYLLGVGLVLCMVATAVVFLPQPKADAFHLNDPGRAERVGYFTGKSIIGLDNGKPNRVIANGDVGLTNVIDRASFITIMRNDLYSTNPNDSTGAAFIVLDMLGYLAGPGSTIAQAKAVFEKDWVAAINNAASIDFANNGQVNFNYNINTFWVLKNAEPTGDVAWYSNTSQAPSIIINWGSTDPNSSDYLGRYAIKKSCGNPVGDGTIRSAPNVLTAVHVDDDQAGAAMWWMNDALWNRIACISPFDKTCIAANITDRQGYYYSIKLTDGNYSVTNNSTPEGYDYVSFDYNGTSYSKDIPASITVDKMNRNPKITWHYKKKPTQICSPVASPVGINESTTFNSSAQTGNSWYAGYANLPNTGTGVNFTVSYSQIGNYPVVLTVNGVATLTCWVVVTQRPYIRAYGGDIFAGSSSCDIVGWKNNGGNAGIYGFMGYIFDTGKGSGAQLGVLAMGPVWGFNSAMLRTIGSGIPQPPNDLTFGNESSPLGKIGISECPPDYWGKKTRTINNVINMGLGTIDLVNYTSGEYYADSARGTVVINMVDIPIGRVVNLYVEGDLLILGNIKYQNATAWTSVDQIPRLQIVVRGNISIDKSVTQLDGIYVAQGKTIYTCSNFNPDNIRTECNTQLTVNGALVATKIKWLRTFGHWLNSSASENPNSVSNCTSLGVTYTKPTCASEIVNLGPEAWMVEQLTANPSADYIQALPPLL